MIKTKQYNIAVKLLLTVVSIAIGLLIPVHILLRIAIGLCLAVAANFALSRMLRYTPFQYSYYRFASKFIYKDKTGSRYCNCCGKHLDFYDHGFATDSVRFNPEAFKGIEQKVYCPFCDSAPRQRIIATWLEANLDLLKRSRILFFAPELSTMLWFKSQDIKPVTADLYDKKADLKLDITDTKLEDGSYDLILCNHVLEHVNDYKKTLSELRRVLSNNGKLIISFPIDDKYDQVYEAPANNDEERKKLYGQHDHVRIFGKNSKTLLEEAGYSVETIDVSSIDASLLPITAPAYYDSNIIFVCTKA